MNNCEIIPLKIWSEPEKLNSIMMLQFACQNSGTEAEARLARQIPRYIGTKLFRSGLFEPSFYALRNQQNNVFINATEPPPLDIIDNIAQSNSTPYLLFGKVGIAEKLKFEFNFYDAKFGKIVLKKGVETYPTYIFDSLDELCLKIINYCELQLTREQRMSLFMRDTLVWEAFLYYLFAEDERYAYSVGIELKEPEKTISHFLEALRFDPDFELAQQACSDFISLLYSHKTISAQKATGYLQNIISVATEHSFALKNLMLIYYFENDISNAQICAKKLPPSSYEDPDIMGIIEELLQNKIPT